MKTEIEQFNEQCERLRRRCVYQIVFGVTMRMSDEIEIEGMTMIPLIPSPVFVVLLWHPSHAYEEEYCYKFPGYTIVEAIDNAYQHTTPPRASIDNLAFLKKKRDSDV